MALLCTIAASSSPVIHGLIGVCYLVNVILPILLEHTGNTGVSISMSSRLPDRESVPSAGGLRAEG